MILLYCAGAVPKEVHWEGPAGRRLTMAPHNYDASVGRLKYAELKIDAARPQDAGLYRCIALDATGAASITRSLKLEVINRHA